MAGPQTPLQADEALDPSTSRTADDGTLHEAFAAAGRKTVVVLSLLAVIDSADNAGFGILAPDIQDSLGLSTTTITVVAALAGFTVFLAALPLGVLGDRVR